MIKMATHYIVHFEPLDILAESTSHAESIASKQFPIVSKVIPARLSFDIRELGTN